jgi:crossover junction endodeoxyribonuclease RuvC
LALAVARETIPVAEFSPLEVKNAVVGYGKATKGQVQDMIKVLLNLDAIPRPDDAADALALAIGLVHAGPRHLVSMQ